MFFISLNRNGCDKSGLYCVFATVLERLRIEQDIDIQHIIKQTRNRRPQIILNYVGRKSYQTIGVCNLVNNIFTKLLLYTKIYSRMFYLNFFVVLKILAFMNPNRCFIFSIYYVFKHYNLFRTQNTFKSGCFLQHLQKYIANETTFHHRQNK